MLGERREVLHILILSLPQHPSISPDSLQGEEKNLLSNLSDWQPWVSSLTLFRLVLEKKREEYVLR